MVGNIIFNTRQIYIYRYLKCQFFTSLFARNDYHITAKPRKTCKKYFDYLAAKPHKTCKKSFIIRSLPDKYLWKEIY